MLSIYQLARALRTVLPQVSQPQAHWFPALVPDGVAAHNPTGAQRLGLGARVVAAVGSAQRRRGNVGIDFRRRHIRMTQHRLHRAVHSIVATSALMFGCCLLS